MLKQITQTKLFGSLKILLAGTFLSQAIIVLASPIITRIYSPNEFGEYALFVSAFSAIFPLSMLRYEMAIVLPAARRAKQGLAMLSLFFCVASSLLVAIPCLLWGESIGSLFGPNSGIWLPWIPLAVLLSGLFQVFYQWNLSANQMSTLASSKVINSGVVASSHVALGLSGFGLKGLIAGSLAGRLVSLVRVSVRSGMFNKLSPQYVYDAGKAMAEYKRFPRYQLPATFLNMFFGHAKFLIFGFIFLPNTVGHLYLSFKVLLLPATLLCSSVAESLYVRQVAWVHSGLPAHSIRARTMKVFRLGLFFYLPACALFFFFGPDIFSRAFGSEWRLAGVYAAILAPGLLAQFTVSTLSKTFLVYNKNHMLLIWEASRVLATYIPLLLLARWGYSEQDLVIFVSGITFLSYIALFMMLRRVLTNGKYSDGA